MKRKSRGGWAADDMFGERERETIADTSMEALREVIIHTSLHTALCSSYFKTHPVSKYTRICVW